MVDSKKGTPPRQMTIYDLISKPEKEKSDKKQHEGGSVNVQRSLRAAVIKAIKECPSSRYQIAAIMSELMDIEVTRYMLDSYTSESKEGHRFPAEFLSAFCIATGSIEPIRVLSEAAGLFAMPGPEALRAEIQRLDEDAKRISTEKRKRLILLKEIGG